MSWGRRGEQDCDDTRETDPSPEKPLADGGQPDDTDSTTSTPVGDESNAGEGQRRDRTDEQPAEEATDAGTRADDAVSAAEGPDLEFELDELTERLERGSAAARDLEHQVEVAPDGSTETADEDLPAIDPADLSNRLTTCAAAARTMVPRLGEQTVDVHPDLDEDAFFTGVDGTSTVVDRYDLEKAVSRVKKRHFREVERYWVNKPYAFVVIFHSEKENEEKYFVIEPHLTDTERDLLEFLMEKLKDSIKYSWDTGVDDSPGARAEVIEREVYELLSRYGIYEASGHGDGGSVLGRLRTLLGMESTDAEEPASGDAGRDAFRQLYPDVQTLGELAGNEARPEAAVLTEDETTLSEYQTEKLLYYLRRDFVGYGRIDPIKHDVAVEDISCDGYDAPVFVYHTDREQLITNISHGRESLDDFVVKLAQRSGKSISKRQPQVDATLPDGSRAQLTLGTEVSDRGTNYTIRQFKDVPYTPIDLINWNTFSLEQTALLWLCIENEKSIMFAGGTASGKTTSLNALSLFIPSDTKIVSIEDTREVELPQRNWIASVTRPTLSEVDEGDVDEFDLLEAALRQRPDYIVMGEVRGEEGRTLFQMMSTGHTTYTTFHADSVGEVIDRFTTNPIDVSKTMFTALDLISIQTQTSIRGRRVRRNKTLTEINHYDAELGEINVQDIYRWQPATDSFRRMLDPNILGEIQFDRGWDDERLESELFKRRVLLAYLVDAHIDTYAEVAAAIQGFISDPDTILGLLAQGRLDQQLADLRSLESVRIDVDPEKEEMVPRPDPSQELLDRADSVLSDAEARLFDEYEDVPVADIETTLPDPVTFDWNTGLVDGRTGDEIEPEPTESGGERPLANGEGSSGSAEVD